MSREAVVAAEVGVRRGWRGCGAAGLPGLRAAGAWPPRTAASCRRTGQATSLRIGYQAMTLLSSDVNMCCSIRNPNLESERLSSRSPANHNREALFLASSWICFGFRASNFGCASGQFCRPAAAGSPLSAPPGGRRRTPARGGWYSSPARCSAWLCLAPSTSHNSLGCAGRGRTGPRAISGLM